MVGIQSPQNINQNYILLFLTIPILNHLASDLFSIIPIPDMSPLYLKESNKKGRHYSLVGGNVICVDLALK